MKVKLSVLRRTLSHTCNSFVDEFLILFKCFQNDYLVKKKILFVYLDATHEFHYYKLVLVSLYNEMERSTWTFKNKNHFWTSKYFWNVIIFIRRKMIIVFRSVHTSLLCTPEPRVIVDDKGEKFGFVLSQSHNDVLKNIFETSHYFYSFFLLWSVYWNSAIFRFVKISISSKYYSK